MSAQYHDQWSRSNLEVRERSMEMIVMKINVNVKFCSPNPKLTIQNVHGFSNVENAHMNQIQNLE